MESIHGIRIHPYNQMKVTIINERNERQQKNKIKNNKGNHSGGNYYGSSCICCYDWNTNTNVAVCTKLSINLFIYESRPNHEKIEDVLFMQIQILNLAKHAARDPLLEIIGYSGRLPTESNVAPGCQVLSCG
jgi:hypothetical protein